MKYVLTYKGKCGIMITQIAKFALFPICISSITCFKADFKHYFQKTTTNPGVS